MSMDISNAFIKQFERETHEAYQRMGSKLRPTVRAKTGVVGASTIFPIVGKGAAMTKARNGMVPTMNVTHATAECFLQDYYAGDWVDRLDELKTDIDERQVLANAGAYALGRQTDSLIIGTLDTSTNYAGGNSDGMTLDKILTAFEMLGAISPDDIKEANRHIEAMAAIDSADTQLAIQQVNESLRAEVASEDPYVRRMRPTFGYIMAVTWAAQMLALAWTILADPAHSGDVINSMSSLSTIWSVGLAVLGVYVYKRSEEKGVKKSKSILPAKLFGMGG